jgi:hypothetical protein
LTRDIDGLVWLDENDWPSFLAESTRFGFQPRVTDALAFAHTARVLLLRHAASQIDVDIAFAALPFEQDALARAHSIQLRDLRIPVPTPEDLVIMKAVAHRPRDLADVEGVIAAHPKLDRRRIRKYLREFAALLERPELLDDIENLFAASGTGQRRSRPKRQNDPPAERS